MFNGLVHSIRPGYIVWKQSYIIVFSGLSSQATHDVGEMRAYLTHTLFDGTIRYRMSIAGNSSDLVKASLVAPSNIKTYESPVVN